MVLLSCSLSSETMVVNLLVSPICTVLRLQHPALLSGTNDVRSAPPVERERERKVDSLSYPAGTFCST